VCAVIERVEMSCLKYSASLELECDFCSRQTSMSCSHNNGKLSKRRNHFPFLTGDVGSSQQIDQKKPPPPGGVSFWSGSQRKHLVELVLFLYVLHLGTTQKEKPPRRGGLGFPAFKRP